MAVTNPTVLRQVLRDEAKKVFDRAGAKVAAVGVSGGVNSALALAVAADVVGKENVAAVYMGAHSNPASLECARAVAKSQGVNLIELDVSNDVDSLWSQFRDRTTAWEPALDNPKGLRIESRISAELFQAAIVARGSIRSCIRSTILDSYGKAFAINRAVARGDQNYYGVLIMGTGDEGEDRFFRFFNKRGDGNVDVSLLSSLTKNEHRQAAVLCYGVPREVAYQKSGPDLQHDVLLPGQDKHVAEEEMSRSFGAILTYGAIDPKTDKYASYGTLEWVARMDDKYGLVTGANQDVLAWRVKEIIGPDADDRLVGVIMAARKFERCTRHKTATQAGIPRHVFLSAGAITDGPDVELPVSFDL